MFYRKKKEKKISNVKWRNVFEFFKIFFKVEYIIININMNIQQLTFSLNYYTLYMQIVIFIFHSRNISSAIWCKESLMIILFY